MPNVTDSGTAVDLGHDHSSALDQAPSLRMLSQFEVLADAQKVGRPVEWCQSGGAAAATPVLAGFSSEPLCRNERASP